MIIIHLTTPQAMALRVWIPDLPKVFRLDHYQTFSDGVKDIVCQLQANSSASCSVKEIATQPNHVLLVDALRTNRSAISVTLLLFFCAFSPFYGFP